MTRELSFFQGKFVSLLAVLLLTIRISKWHSLDFIIKLNSYITVLNQGLNLIIFALTYFVSLCSSFVSLLTMHRSWDRGV